MQHDIFVSKPNALNREQRAFWEELQGMMNERGLRPHCVGEIDFGNAAPIGAVKRVMAQCKGVIVLGLRQTHVISATEREATNREQRIRDTYLPTAWNHIEAGMAFMQGLPVLLVREQGVLGGVFDMGSTDRFVHQVDLASSGWLHSGQFLQPFNEWLQEVVSAQRR